MTKRKSNKEAPDFLVLLESYAKRLKHNSVLFRYNTSYGFLELHKKFVLKVVKTARKRMFLHAKGLDEINDLERLGLIVLHEASQTLPM